MISLEKKCGRKPPVIVHNLKLGCCKEMVWKTNAIIGFISLKKQKEPFTFTSSVVMLYEKPVLISFHKTFLLTMTYFGHCSFCNLKGIYCCHKWDLKCVGII